MEAKRHNSGSLRIQDVQAAQSESSGRLRSRGMQYRRLMPLGSGGMATVHLALAAGPSGFNRLVVVKAMRDELLELPEARAMFLDEARLCARLNHPNVVQVSEVVDSPAGVMIVMEYLDGRPLSAMYQAGDDFTLLMRLRVVCEVLAGLHYVHELKDFEGEPLGLVHRDVSPHNVFATFDGRVKLLDFGIAKATFASEHTKTGVIKGKLTYMPAEQLRGHPVDRRSDIYSVGCILWEAVAGSRIWNKRPDKDIMQSVLRGDIPRLSSRVDVDPRLEHIVSRATALDPDQRYATAEEMRLELEELLHTAAPISPRDIGEFLSTAFAEANQKRHAEVAQLIAALPESAGSEVATEFQASMTTSGQASSSGLLPRRRWVWPVAALGLIGVAVFVSPLLRRASLPEAPSADASRPVVSQVALSVSVLPKTARVIVDDGPASIGGALTRVAANSEHVVRVESEGYSPVERRVTLANDTTMTIDLPILPAPSASAVASSPAPDSVRHKGSASSARNQRLKAPFPSVPPVRVAGAAAPACSPPYYFVGGIKTFKPECI
jgi:eukaryotic-like serine/threonine-protein kinase